ncbi:hypothetical protein DFH09DRAFT_180020 [Mycena vulgaris]|nr:hypothetical protein DFH09DRAFT_180020 [Mycena vulgaris]
MPLIAPPTTWQERLQQNVDKNPALAAVFEDGLDGTFHYKALSRPALEGHADMRIKWRAFVEFYAEAGQARHELPSEIELGVELVTEGIVKEFVTFLAVTTKPLLTDVAARVSIKNYVNRFWALWKRYANVHVPTTLRNQTQAYIDSMDMKSVAPLTTDMRKKLPADGVDLVKITNFTWNDTRIFRTFRSKAQFNVINDLSALTGERPGAIMESTSYRKTNEALTWADVKFMIIPNSTTPREPHQSLLVTFRLPKGHRGDEHYFKSFFLLQEPVGQRAHCLVTILLYLALLDAIFRDVDSIGEIVNPLIAPTAVHILELKEECKSMLVFRGEEYIDGHWVTSATRALQASTHSNQLNRVTLAMGFKVLMAMYCWRRGAAGRFNEVLGEEKRKNLMTHGINSRAFEEAYQSHLHGHDFGGILHDRGENQENLALIKSATGMSAGADPTAPMRCSLEARGTLLREPELVSIRKQIAEFKSSVANHRSAILCLDADDHEAFAELQGNIRSDTTAHRTLQAKHDAIVNRELKTRLALERQIHQGDHSRRQLTGESAPSAPAMALTRLPLADKTSGNVPLMPKILTSLGDLPSTSGSWLKTIETVDPLARLCDVLYHFAIPNLAMETATAVDAYLGLPNRPFPLCYPGESPTEKEACCPVCSIPCGTGAFRGNGSESVGSHIHKCITKSHQEQAQTFVENEYSPQRCAWQSCKNKHIFPSRTLFVAHIQKHIDSLITVPTLNAPVRFCRWILNEDEDADNDNMCWETVNDVDGDWHKHFAQVHGLNVREKVEVHYCVSCPQWYVDELGDGLLWEGHNHEHWIELFEPFSERVDNDTLDLTPLGVEFTATTENCVDFVPGTGFSGVHPEFHGHFQLGIAHIPGRCPWCVFNDLLPIEERMHQWLKTTLFVKHIQTHLDDIEDDDNLCPIPSCGTHKFSRFDLLYHLVAFHRLPMCGSTNHTVVRRLRLPTPHVDPIPAVDLAHLDDDDMDVDAPTTTVTVHAKEETERQKKVRLAKESRTSDTVVAGYCLGCTRRCKDIGRHISTSKKCYHKNQYRLADAGSKGPVFNWTLTGPAPTTQPRAGGKKPHKCVVCQRLQADIRDHVNSACKPTMFKIVIEGRNFGPQISIASWVAEQDAAKNGAGDDRGEGSSKRTDNEEHSQEEDDNDDDEGVRGSKRPGAFDDDEAPSKRTKPAPVLQAPRDGVCFFHDLFLALILLGQDFVCDGCDERFTDSDELGAHFASLRGGSRSKCRAKVFRQKVSDRAGFRFGKQLQWATWDGVEK